MQKVVMLAELMNRLEELAIEESILKGRLSDNAKEKMDTRNRIRGLIDVVADETPDDGEGHQENEDKHSTGRMIVMRSIYTKEEMEFKSITTAMGYLRCSYKRIKDALENGKLMGEWRLSYKEEEHD